MAIATRRTFCRFCHAACAIEVDVDTAANRVVAVRGDAADPIFGAYTCTKGRHLGEQHHQPDRLRTALKRRPDGGFDPIPTAQALDEIAERFGRLIAEHGPRTLATYCGTPVPKYWRLNVPILGKTTDQISARFVFFLLTS